MATKTKNIVNPKEFEQIVEHCYNPKISSFVVRFLDGSSYVLKIEDLPKKIITNSPDWASAVLSPDRTSIMVKTHKDTKIIPSFIVHSKGKTL